MLGSRFRCVPFVLDESSNNDEVAGALGSLPCDLASSLGGLTIMSAANDTSWLGIGGLPARPPQSVPARIRAPAARSFPSALSVTSSMTESPPLWTGIPTGGAGSGHGGGHGWLSSMDIHAIWDSNSKLQPTQLVYVVAENKICFGMIGTKHFCCSKSCKIKVHKLKSNKFSMGTKDGWSLAGKSNLAGQSNAFV